MNGSDRKKLLDAGFRVLRANRIEKYINELTAKGSWILVSRYKSMAEFDRALVEFRQDAKTIVE